jgi:hypothetical protein
MRRRTKETPQALFGDREIVREWKARLLALSKAVPENTPATALLAESIAMLESGIYGILAMQGNADTLRLVNAIMDDILASEGEPTHWRNRERY